LPGVPPKWIGETIGSVVIWNSVVLTTPMPAVPPAGPDVVKAVPVLNDVVENTRDAA
jgi:hypothetical protein